MTLLPGDSEAVEGYVREWGSWLAAAVAAGGLQEAKWRRREPLPAIAAALLGGSGAP